MDTSPQRPVVIVGGGIAGLSVAKALSGNGLSSILVEKENRLGGHVREWACMAADECLRCHCCAVEDLVDAVESSPTVTVLTGHELSGVARTNGHVEKVELQEVGNGAGQSLDASALVLATGFAPYDPTEKVFWGYGTHDGVITLSDLDTFVRQDDLAGFAADRDRPLRLAFFQCVGSRDSSIGANYCSQYCCKGALRMALRLLKEYPDWEITIFYIDLQIAGSYAGSLLSQAEERNIRLIQGVPGEVVVGADRTLEVVREQDGLNIRETYDRIVLSVGQRPSPDNPGIAAVTGLETDAFGFLGNGGVLDTGRTPVKGLYVAGTAGGPKDIEQTIEQAGQAAAAVVADLKGFGRT